METLDLKNRQGSHRKGGGEQIDERHCTRRWINKIAIQATAQMAADKEALGLSRVHMYESNCILPPLQGDCLFCC